MHRIPSNYRYHFLDPPPMLVSKIVADTLNLHIHRHKFCLHFLSAAISSTFLG
jgi:hypothetical protein